MKGKVYRLIAGLLIATSVLSGCSAVVDREETKIVQATKVKKAVQLAPSSSARFEVIKGDPIYVVVDEDSTWGMIDKVKEAIKQTVEQYNEMFSYINPDYQLKYISRSDYEKGKTDYPFIYITTALKIEMESGTARAATKPIEASVSRHGNGMVYSNSTIIVSSTGTVNMEVGEIQNVLSHEFGHVFGMEEHSEDKTSMMYSHSSGVTLSSKEFSLDMLQRFKKEYYNAQTNDVSEEKVDEYILRTTALRQQQVEQYLQEHGDIGQANEEKGVDKFKQNLAKYLDAREMQTMPAEDMVGIEFSTTSIYGQTRTITFNEDGTYLLQVYDEERSIECKGKYFINGNIVVCEGEYFKVDSEFNYVKTQDKLYVSAFEGGCVYGTESGKGAITGELAESSLIEDFGV